ncbi:hypothetical protein FJ365_02525 [Candidatus Dependentiae bacterium]|nr:hypothetical protein [Candidatus Dependentiae bacterium]
MIRCTFFSLFLICMVVWLQADYLIVKKVPGVDGTTNLQAVGADNTTPEQQFELYKIMMTYEWPMSSAAYASGVIPTEEAEVLFRPGVLGGEKLFIRKKIHEHTLLGSDFDLIFIPKTLYELFALQWLFTLSPKNTALIINRYILLNYSVARANEGEIFKELVKTLDSSSVSRVRFLGAYFAGTDLANYGAPSFSFTLDSEQRSLKTQIFDKDYQLVYSLIAPSDFAPGKLIGRDYGLFATHMDLNQALSREILDGAATTSSIDDVEHWINENADVLAVSFVRRLGKCGLQLDAVDTSLRAIEYSMPTAMCTLCRTGLNIDQKCLTDRIDHEIKRGGVIHEMIALDFDCYRKNYASIVRTPPWQSAERLKMQLDAGMFYNPDRALQGVLLDAVSGLLTNKPSETVHSLSYGNSLFAGFVLDEGACVYKICVGKSIPYGWRATTYENSCRETCYALEIDKAEYVFNNRCNGLFFIPPLPTFLGIMGNGEFFHPRTRIVAPVQPQMGKFNKLILPGIYGTIKDNMMQFWAPGEIHHQELLFQEYFIQHVHFIKLPNDPVAFIEAARLASKAMQEHDVKVRKVRVPELMPAPLKRARCSADFE